MTDLVAAHTPDSRSPAERVQAGTLQTVAGNLLGSVFAVSASTLKPPSIDDEATSARLKQVVFTVTECCQITVLDPNFERLVPRLHEYGDELLGFAYEGAGIGFAALDTLIPTKRRTRDFAKGPGAPYIYGIYLGAGMGLARMRLSTERFLRRLDDPLWGWVILDGYGFHEGFFAHDKHVIRHQVPRHIRGYAQRAFDHGVGRSIWFSGGADVDRVAEIIATFPAARHPDLWQGIGLACGYTGGVERPVVESLQAVAGRYQAHLAVGAAMSASIRHQVGNTADHNDFASEVLCGMSSSSAADVVDGIRFDLPTDPSVPSYALWRQRILRHFS